MYCLAFLWALQWLTTTRANARSRNWRKGFKPWSTLVLRMGNGSTRSNCGWRRSRRTDSSGLKAVLEWTKPGQLLKMVQLHVQGSDPRWPKLSQAKSGLHFETWTVRKHCNVKPMSCRQAGGLFQLWQHEKLQPRHSTSQILWSGLVKTQKERTTSDCVRENPLDGRLIRSSRSSKMPNAQSSMQIYLDRGPKTRAKSKGKGKGDFGDSGRGTTKQAEVSFRGSPQGRDDPIGIPHYDGTGQWA